MWTPQQRAEKVVQVKTSMYLHAEDVLIEPGNIEASPRIEDTLQIHMIKRFFNKQKVPYLQFFKTGSQ